MKSRRFLLVETPRGGPYGHRFLVPPENDLRPEEVELIFQKASQGRTGNFIAVQRMVEQHLPNGSIREGSETLLLSGIKSSELEQHQIDAVKKKLARKLTDLEKLVTRTIKWGEAGNNTIIIRKELMDWQDDLSPFIREEPVETQDRSPAGSGGLIMGVVLGAALGFAALYVIFR